MYSMDAVWRVAVGIAIFLVFLLLAYGSKVILLRIKGKVKSHAAVLGLGAKILQITIIIIGVITALGTCGVNVTALVTSLGLFGFAVGFALKDLLSNTLAGVMILLYKPFGVGNVISGSSFQGKVIEINLRYVVLEDKKKKILVPNSLILSNVITLGA